MTEETHDPIDPDLHPDPLPERPPADLTDLTGYSNARPDTPRPRPGDAPPVQGRTAPIKGKR